MRQLLLLVPLAFAAAAWAHAEVLQTDELAVDKIIPRLPYPYPVTELFPVEPGVDAQRGFAVAVDGDWMAVGAHLDDEKGEDAGAVHVFHWSGTTWDYTQKLFATPPQLGAHFGSSLALREDRLAVGALGEGAGAVYVFAEGNSFWAQDKRLTGTGDGRGTFGRSLALDSGRLAVGAVAAHGATHGAVYIYSISTWALEQPQPIRPQVRQAGERFGSAIALAGSFLVVGAPGYDAGTDPAADDAGAVYVFQRGPSRWRQKERLLAPDATAGQQLGVAVVTDGREAFAGAPTADLAGANSGAVYRFVRGAVSWSGEHIGDGLAGDQLGFSLALSESILVAGAPAPPPAPGAAGTVRVFRRADAAWDELMLLPGNSEGRDLSGFAVAVGGDRVAVGGVLGDQASGAAGAVWSFRCPEGEDGCFEEAEAVARDPLLGRRFGVSVALTDDVLVVGAPESDEISTGAVYLSRRAGTGWRQEVRLTSPYPGDGFGSSVALHGSVLAIGAPQPRVSPVSPPIAFPNGSVDLYVRGGDGSWTFDTVLAPPPAPPSESAFGASIALGDEVVVVGAPGAAAVHIFERKGQVWTEAQVLASEDKSFGASISLRGDLLAIGAPGARDGVGALFVSVRSLNGWDPPMDLSNLLEVPDVHPGPDALGSSVAAGDGIIAVGAPDFLGGLGAVYLFERDGASWKTTQLSARAPRRFGSSVALFGNRLVVGGPGQGPVDPDDLDRVAVFERRNGAWEVVADLDAVQPPHGDQFGAAVALSRDFFVVTSPGSARGDRVTVFALHEEDR